MIYLDDLTLEGMYMLFECLVVDYFINLVIDFLSHCMVEAIINEIRSNL